MTKHMETMEPRHKFGTFALILCLTSLLLALFSTGATWATVDTKSSETVNDEFFGQFDVDVNLKADLKLREMNSEVAVYLTFDTTESGEGEMYGGTETYENIADKSGGDMKSTFEDMDSAGSVAQWMLWLGIITMFLTAILCFSSLAQITNSRFTTYSGAIGTFLLFFAPIMWFILLPSDGTYTDMDLVAEFFFFFDESVFATDFEPSPSTGVFLSLFAGLNSIGMMFMVYKHNTSPIASSKPNWMIRLFNFFTNDEEQVAQQIDFSEKKEQAALLVKKSVNAYKNSRMMQAVSILIILIIISIPLYSMLFEEPEEADAYQRELQYVVEGESDYIYWVGITTEVINDGETFTLTFTEQDFPEEAKEHNIVYISLSVYVMDNQENNDNEETSGVTCTPVTSGNDAPDSINYAYSTPGGSSDAVTQNGETEFYVLHPVPEEGFGPYSGYTVEEIEELFDSSESIVGEYQFQYTANAQAGQASGGCERDDPSVQIQYYIELLYFDYEVVEFTGFEE